MSTTVKLLIRYFNGGKYHSECIKEHSSMMDAHEWLRGKQQEVNDFLNGHKDFSFTLGLYYKRNGKEHFVCYWTCKEPKDYVFMLDKFMSKCRYIYCD